MPVNTKNPECPECHSDKFIKNGTTRLICKDCGRSYRTEYRGRKEIDFSIRPPCPFCGAMHSTKHDARRYCCGECGRSFSINSLNEQLNLNSEVISA